MVSLFALALFAAAPAQACAFDERKMMSLSLDAFDQDLGGGWRAVARTPACRKAAADLIARYRRRHGNATMLYWHEGQLRAQAGQTARAIRLFDRARRPAEDDLFGWNLYVDASVAFLRRDRTSLLAAREKLARLPRPASFNPIDRSGTPLAVSWPPNLNVVDGFIACFGKGYDEAYTRCTKPFIVVR